jgi:hypothetical protein
MTEVSESTVEVEQCGEPTSNGPCERGVKGGGPCFMHDEDGPPDGHGAPKGNLNAADHYLYVEREKMFEALSAGQQIRLLANYEDLLDQSVLDFDVEYREHQIDCRDIPEDERPPTDELGFAFILVPYPTEHQVRAESLWHAAVDSHKMLMLSAKLLETNMEREKTVRSRYDPSEDEWYELTEKREHHLCLEYDRMVRRHMMQVEQGGVVKLQ